MLLALSQPITTAVFRPPKSWCLSAFNLQNFRHPGLCAWPWVPWHSCILLDQKHIYLFSFSYPTTTYGFLFPSISRGSLRIRSGWSQGQFHSVPESTVPRLLDLFLHLVHNVELLSHYGFSSKGCHCFFCSPTPLALTYAHQCMSEHTLQSSRSFPWICWDSCKSLLDREWRVASAYKLSYPSLTKPSQIPVAVSPVGVFMFHSILAQFLGQNLWYRDEQFIQMNEGNSSVTAQRILHSVSSPLTLSVDSCCHPACSVFP